jgi:hypothetical protein
MKTGTHDSEMCEADGSIQREKLKRGKRKGKERSWDGAENHLLTDMTSCVTVTEGAKADAALGEQGDGLDGPCARTGGW